MPSAVAKRQQKSISQTWLHQNRSSSSHPSHSSVNPICFAKILRMRISCIQRRTSAVPCIQPDICPLPQGWTFCSRQAYQQAGDPQHQPSAKAIHVRSHHSQQQYLQLCKVQGTAIKPAPTITIQISSSTGIH